MAKNKQVFELTQEGVDQLKAELRYLKDEKRPEVVAALQEARAQGDLSENADYDSAREEQARTEARIKEIENILENSKLIKTTNDNRINAGKTVKLLFVEKNKEVEYQLVGTIEANPLQNKISIESPVGAAVIGQNVGDTVSVRLETGKTFNVTILEVR
ncbi:MAG: transcription elongation factor GreA [Paracholeplasma sp.]|jgi:transcription elongation factor GreA|uniref:Transcription elongation factor GreA n=1 Tax=Acholeplasma brassicae TaxID=61635 RepID=U4KRT4_9MOLU|nr:MULTISPECIES: transcription elongation factor GreA [Paracholeplasma]MDY3196015.1 transcription elongation factor GreA [Paracholeplasma sp.]CCV66048.1 Transcription elongation factor GreA (transcript cleavage factor) [Paracholeplasma brassicae]HBT60010.1 transcription elongation factor GreA [Acholeplasmataceae bacterium]